MSKENDKSEKTEISKEDKTRLLEHQEYGQIARAIVEEARENERSRLRYRSAIIGAIGAIIAAIIVALPQLYELVNRPSPPLCSGSVIGEAFDKTQFKDGEFWVWENAPGSLTSDFTEDCAYSSLHGVHLTYGFTDDGNGGMGVNWGRLAPEGFDASDSATINFWVRDNTGNGEFEVGLRDTSGVQRVIQSDQFVVSTSWNEVEIDLTQFPGVDRASIENVHFAFNHTHGSGSICIDDITFE